MRDALAAFGDPDAQKNFVESALGLVQVAFPGHIPIRATMRVEPIVKVNGKQIAVLEFTMVLEVGQPSGLVIPLGVVPRLPT